MEKGSFDVVVFLLSFRGEEERGAGDGDTMAHGNAPWSRRRGWQCPVVEAERLARCWSCWANDEGWAMSHAIWFFTPQERWLIWIDVIMLSHGHRGREIKVTCDHLWPSEDTLHHPKGPPMWHLADMSKQGTHTLAHKHTHTHRHTDKTDRHTHTHAHHSWHILKGFSNNLANERSWKKRKHCHHGRRIFSPMQTPKAPCSTSSVGLALPRTGEGGGILGCNW